MDQSDDEVCRKLTSNVDVIHVGLWDLLADFLDQSQSELNVVRLAGLSVDIPSENKMNSFCRVEQSCYWSRLSRYCALIG